MAIETVWMVLSRDANGNEGALTMPLVPGIDPGAWSVPLVTTDAYLRALVRAVGYFFDDAARHGTELPAGGTRLVRFSGRTEAPDLLRAGLSLPRPGLIYVRELVGFFTRDATGEELVPVVSAKLGNRKVVWPFVASQRERLDRLYAFPGVRGVFQTGGRFPVRFHDREDQEEL